MKYRATVVSNDHSKGDCPHIGCIRVTCPEVFKYKVKTIQSEHIQDDLIWSDWIEPLLSAPMDFHVPRTGEKVWIEEGDNGWIWQGSFIQDNYVSAVTGLLMAGINLAVGDVSDRIIGTRWGTYLKLEDRLSGKAVLEVNGDVFENPAILRRVARFILDGDWEQPSFLLQAGKWVASTNEEDPELNFSIYGGGKVGEEKLELKDQKNNNRITANKDGLVLVTGASGTIATINLNQKDGKIEILDQNQNKVTMDSSGIIIEDLSQNKITASSSGIVIEDVNQNKTTMNVSGINITDMAQNVIKLEATGVTITGGKLLTVQGVVVPGVGPFCGLPNCLFTGAPHGGSQVGGI